LPFVGLVASIREPVAACPCRRGRARRWAGPLSSVWNTNLVVGGRRPKRVGGVQVGEDSCRQFRLVDTTSAGTPARRGALVAGLFLQQVDAGSRRGVATAARSR
jgi:hypothetical protein